MLKTIAAYDSVTLAFALADYKQKKNGFLAGIPPQVAIERLTVSDILGAIGERFGTAQLMAALQIPGMKADFLEEQSIDSDASWMHTDNMVGVNVRTIGSFWKLVPYAMTLSNAQSSVHLLPIWEPGVVSSLYGMAAWHINSEFFSEELYRTVPSLNTVEKQLKTVVQLLHLMGKRVGMDVIPHTDRYSEIVLANPWLFEWLVRKDFEIVDHSARLDLAAASVIWDTLMDLGDSDIRDAELFWQLPEEERTAILFGPKEDVAARNSRRDVFVQALYDVGLETVPATMGPPYRGLQVRKDASACTIDEKGRIWRDYEITEPTHFSRAFGPLTRYKLYHAKEDNLHWVLDFENPNVAAWEYVQAHYKSVALEYGFDFMRGDMSHVQMRTEMPETADAYYDILLSVKRSIAESKPDFGYFAESFLAPPNTMAYGDEVQHLALSEAETALGDLQSAVVDSEAWRDMFSKYVAWAETASFRPCLTMMTADKDDPRFDAFYVNGSVARFFIGLFLPGMPSYMGLGFEQRDVHLSPAENEFYTKNYVFYYAEGEKAVRGPYRWGSNFELFEQLNELRLLAEKYPALPKKGGTPVWLLGPDLSDAQPILAWQCGNDPRFICVVNTNLSSQVLDVHLPLSDQLTCLYGSNGLKTATLVDSSVLLGNLLPGECLLFSV